MVCFPLFRHLRINHPLERHIYCRSSHTDCHRTIHYADQHRVSAFRPLPLYFLLLPTEQPVHRRSWCWSHVCHRASIQWWNSPQENQRLFAGPVPIANYHGVRASYANHPSVIAQFPFFAQDISQLHSRPSYALNSKLRILESQCSDSYLAGTYHKYCFTYRFQCVKFLSISIKARIVLWQVGLQMLWGLILISGMLFLPESP